ncbi:MAG: metallophosphoesterase [Clostridiales bacterium]|nr:metallophosphoesterase [Clostridiales bacterium]
MKLYAIADLHMDSGAGKPMDVFGPMWERHCERIFGSWQSVVGEEDFVLIPGDVSWAMHFKEALPDLMGLSLLPGTKLIIRGNHDYWWGSLTQMRAALPKNVRLIRNDACDCGPFIACGSRGWTLPSSNDFTAEDRKIYERELIRLELSLSAARRLADKAKAETGEIKPLVCMTHYPPVMKDGEPTGFSALLEKYGVSRCLYGHLHGPAAWEAGFKGEKNGVIYALCSADSVDFTPMFVEEYEYEEDRTETA